MIFEKTFSMQTTGELCITTGEFDPLPAESAKNLSFFEGWL
jgi:hypothetical protein